MAEENVAEEMEEEILEEGGFLPSEGTQGYEEGDEEYLTQEEEMSLIGDEEENPEQKRRYLEYLGLVKEIKFQNETINKFKAQIKEMCAMPCKKPCEQMEIQRLRQCLEQENTKLNILINQAMKLQNFGSHRRYPDVPIATTFDEDNMAPCIATCFPPQNVTNANSETEKSCTSSQDYEDIMQELCCAMENMKVCPRDKKVLNQVADILCNQKRPQQPKTEAPPCPQECCRPHCPVCKQIERSQQAKQAQRKQKPSPKQKSQGGSLSPEVVCELKERLCCMQEAIDHLREKIRKKEKEQIMRSNIASGPCEKQRKPCPGKPDPLLKCESTTKKKTEQMAKLKESYMYLLSEFTKKDNQLKELEKRAKVFCGGCNAKVEEMKSVDASELELLRTRVCELKEEQVEFKCIMKEQAQQLEDYRNKYLEAQTTVEEQEATLKKLNMNNKRIEKQINSEVKEIRAKFQEKLNELLHFPKLLENEQIKLAETCKEKEELQGKLVLICKELQSIKSELESSKDKGQDCRPQLAKCQMDLSKATKELEELQRQRDMICEKLKTTEDDLNTLRSESVKIIVRTKERAEILRQQQQEQINRLEKQLAQCRASASLSIKDRETVIREMQGQLNTLSYSFDAAQKQIKTLRNHIAYVSNENCFPIKC